MPIYNRDQINYGSLIQNAIANRNAAAQRDAAYITNFGNIAANAVKDTGGVIGRGLALYESDEDEAELARLKKLKEEMEQAAIAKNAAQEEYKDYRPAIPSNYVPAEATMSNITEEPTYIPYYLRGRR